MVRGSNCLAQFYKKARTRKGEFCKPLRRKTLECASFLSTHDKTKGHPKGCPFVLGSAAQGAAPPFGISMLGVGKAAPAPRFSPAVKTLVRRTCAAAQKGRWVVFKKSVEDLKISRLSAGTWFYLSFNSLTRTARLKSCRSRCFCPPRPCLNRAASIVLPNKICYVLFINCLTVRGILIGKRLHSPVHRGCIPAHVT